MILKIKMNSKKLFCPLLCGSTYNNFNLHLNFCQNKHLIGKYFFKCPFNSSHILSKKLIDIHIQNCPNKNKENINSLNEIDNLNINKFSKVKESKKEIELKQNEKKLKLNNNFQLKIEEEDEINKIIYEKNNSTKEIFSFDKLVHKNEKDEKYSVSTNKSDHSDISEERDKTIYKTNKKKVTFGRMTKVILFKNKDNKKQISNDGQYMTEVYLKFL